MAEREAVERVGRAAVVRRRERGGAETGQPGHPLLELGRRVGNARIARMLAQREDVGPLEEEEDPSMLQAKHDPVLARQVVAQREGLTEEDELERTPDLAQREAMPEVGLAGGPVSDGLAARIETQRGGGAPLPEGTRASMEGAFGASFDDVRVHTGGEAEALNRNVSARAFTTGSDIFFGRGASPGDASLLAHELTHVVQQRGATGGGPLTVSPAGDADEQAADSASAAVVSSAGAGAGAAQRHAEEEPAS